MADPVRLAHIGVAYPHGDGYIETLLLMPGIELVALYDPDPAAARALLPPEFQGLGVYDDFDEVLRKERPEAVLITQPNDTTARFITQAAEAGVHVFAEKPCARTAAELMPAIEAVRKSGVRFSTGYTRRVSPAGLAIKEIIERGVLGSLVSIEASWVTTSVQSRGPDNPMFSAERNGGGILHWLGCHWLDFMRWSTSAEVSEVSAILDTLSGEQIDVEDTAAVSLRFDNGMIGSLHCTYAIDKMPHQLFFGLRGSDGWLRWDYMGGEIEVRSARADWSAGVTQVLRFETDDVGGYEMGDGVAVLRRFVESIREDRPAAMSPIDALRILEIIDAAHESSRTGRRVAVARAEEIPSPSTGVQTGEMGNSCSGTWVTHSID